MSKEPLWLDALRDTRSVVLLHGRLGPAGGAHAVDASTHPRSCMADWGRALARTRLMPLQGYLAHKKMPTPLGNL
jgi:hypothetical protein